MKDIVAEVRDWERRFKADYERSDSLSLPTEANVLRQFTYGAISDFLAESLGDPEFITACQSHSDVPLANYVVSWVDRTYGPDEQLDYPSVFEEVVTT